MAFSADYDVAANWKLVWENNRECCHCDVNHPQYIKANFDRYDAGTLSEEIERQIETATTRSQAKWAACGLSTTPRPGCLHSPMRSTTSGIPQTAPRLRTDTSPSRSMAGASRPHGEYADADIGTLRLRTLPWNIVVESPSSATTRSVAGQQRRRLTGGPGSRDEGASSAYVPGLSPLIRAEEGRQRVNLCRHRLGRIDTSGRHRFLATLS